MSVEANTSSPVGTCRSGHLRVFRDFYASERFRQCLLAFDVATVIAFLALTFVPTSPWTIAADITIGALMLVEFSLRTYVSHDRWAHLRRPGTLLDIVIIGSLLFPPLIGSFSFLRVLRAMRLFRALKVVRQILHKNRTLATRAELIGSVANLVVFIFVTSAIVFEAQVGRNPAIQTFADALYFTVTTLTTTGFGDITLTGDSGRLLAVFIMLCGISLFIKMAQAIVRPSKVHVECGACGLSRHEPDAVHCKHCGAVVHIPNEG